MELLNTWKVKRFDREVALDEEAARGFKSWRRILQSSDYTLQYF